MMHRAWKRMWEAAYKQGRFGHVRYLTCHVESKVNHGIGNVVEDLGFYLYITHIYTPITPAITFVVENRIEIPFPVVKCFV